MSTTIIPAARPLPAPGKSTGWTTRACRNLLHIWLDRIDGARLTLIDGEDRRTFGKPSIDPTQDPHCTLTVRHPRFYRDAVLGGHLTASEGYVHQLWDCDDLTALVRIFARNLQLSDDMDGVSVKLGGLVLRLGHWLKRNTTRGSRANIAAHYDLGNDFFEHLLDPTMMYSAAVFPGGGTPLHEAQLLKLDRLCQKLDLQPTDHLLEIGTGWGGLALHAAKHYGCRVTTTTLSKKQRDYAAARFRDEGVDHLIDLRMQDYRELDGRYDKLVSVEMIEAVGHEYYPAFFAACDRLLTPTGRGVIQCITIADQRYDQARRTIDFIKKYVFPGSCIPSITALSRAMARGSTLRMTHLEDLTPHYATTLHHWHRRMVRHRNEILALGYPEELLRMWSFYLAYCEGGFIERNIGLVHFEVRKPGCVDAPLTPPSLTSAADAAVAGLAGAEESAA